jgi:alpha-L-fucosidase
MKHQSSPGTPTAQVRAALALAALWMSVSSFGGPAPAPDSARLHWWQEDRFGLFIHWGPVSLKGTEISWSRANSNPRCPNKGPIPVEVYDNLYREFNPTNFNAKEWAKVAKAAGTRYVVLTAKHCDGFCLWPTRRIEYHIGRTPFQRDVSGELARAVRQAGLRMGWYYSPMDWYDPDCRTDRNAAYVSRMQGQLRELLTAYGRIDLLWFDWDGMRIPWDQANTYQLVRQAQPRIIVNNRLDCSFGGFSADHYIGPNADYYTPEQVIGAYDDQHPWETCMTLGTQWSWKPNDQIKSVKETVQILARCVGGDGNLLLNVGPMPTGEIEPRQVEVLKGVGAWLRTNGQSIYGTRGGPFKPGRFGASTRKGRTIFLHVFNWTGESLSLPPIRAKVIRSRLLNGGKPRVVQSDSGVEISVTPAQRDPVDTVVALDLDRSAATLEAVSITGSRSVAQGAKATASNIFQQQAEFGPEKAIDGNDDTRWATDAGTTNAWLALDFGRPLRFKRAALAEAFPERVRRFELQWLEGTEWRTFYSGKTIGEWLTCEFAPVTAREVRLNVLEATDGPTLWEFQLFE